MGTPHPGFFSLSQMMAIFAFIGIWGAVANWRSGYRHRSCLCGAAALACGVLLSLFVGQLLKNNDPLDWLWSGPRSCYLARTC